MFVFIGAGVVIVSVLGGYVAGGGEIAVLIQPFEWLIIIGAAMLIKLDTTPDRKPVDLATVSKIDD